MKKIKVVMGGSGALYPIYLGCLVRLQEEGYEIVSVGGSSGGAIAATLWASPTLENTKDNLKQFIARTLPKNNKKVLKIFFTIIIHTYKYYKKTTTTT